MGLMVLFNKFLPNEVLLFYNSMVLAFLRSM